MQQESLVIGMKAIVRPAVERLRPVGCPVFALDMAIDDDELLPVEAKLLARGIHEAAEPWKN